jgi:glycosyltransferase involved in cell wall biosynthesis
MKNTPNISVLLPVFNGAKFIRFAIESVLNQTWPDYEIIVVDNLSNDETCDEVKKINDRRIRLIQEKKHVSIYENFNRAASYARGCFLKFLCADDELMPSNLRSLIQLLTSNPSVSLVTSSRIRIDEFGNQHGIMQFFRKTGVISTSDALQYIAEYGNFIGEPTTTMVRKASFERHNGFSIHLKQLGDMDLWCRLLTDGDLYYHPIPLSKFRCHKGQLSVFNKNDPNIWIIDEIVLSQSVIQLARRIGMSSATQKLMQDLFAARLLRITITAYFRRPIRLIDSARLLLRCTQVSVLFRGLLYNILKLFSKSGIPMKKRR